MSGNPPSPSVSVVIPTRGRRALLRQTLDSIAGQTLTDWEAVVVDDHSPDDTATWLASVAAADHRVRPVALVGPGGGANAARNRGLAAARARYVVFLDSDDLLEPDCLRTRVDRLDARPDLDFTVNAMRCFKVQPNDRDVAWNTLTAEDDFDRFLLLDGPWQTAAATWRRSALPRVGDWDPHLLSLQDLDFHLRALAAGLPYEKVNAWDCHYRLPHDRPSITGEHRSLPHALSHARIARRLLALPDNLLDATPTRRQRLGGFCFLLASRCAEKGGLAAGVALWHHARRRSVVGGRQFAEGLLMLVGQRWPLVRRWGRRRLFDRWPQACRGEFRSTFLRAPLPPRVGDGAGGT